MTTPAPSSPVAPPMACVDCGSRLEAAYEPTYGPDGPEGAEVFYADVNGALDCPIGLHGHTPVSYTTCATCDQPVQITWDAEADYDGTMRGGAMLLSLDGSDVCPATAAAHTPPAPAPPAPNSPF